MDVNQSSRSRLPCKQLALGHMVYSGRPDDHHSRGVAIITSNEVHKGLLEWKPVSERIIAARYNSAFATLTTVVCYAPTENSEEQERDVFYETSRRQWTKLHHLTCCCLWETSMQRQAETIEGREHNGAAMTGQWQQ